MLEAIQTSVSRSISDEFQLAQDGEQQMFAWGQSVVISEGVLQGLRGTVVKRTAPSQYLVSLDGQSGPVWAKLPEHLFRAS